MIFSRKMFSLRICRALQPGLVKSFWRKPLKFENLQPKYCSSLVVDRDDIYSENLESEEFDSVSTLVDRYCHLSSMQEQVLVIQPFIRYGQLAKTDTSPQLMLEESVALVKTLNWKVVDHMIVGLSSFQKKQLFGSGKLKMLEEKIASDMKITSIFISLYQLTVTQRLELEKTFSVPVIDRF